MGGSKRPKDPSAIHNKIRVIIKINNFVSITEQKHQIRDGRISNLVFSYFYSQVKIALIKGGTKQILTKLANVGNITISRVNTTSGQQQNLKKNRSKMYNNGITISINDKKAKCFDESTLEHNSENITISKNETQLMNKYFKQTSIKGGVKQKLTKASGFFKNESMRMNKYFKQSSKILGIDKQNLTKPSDSKENDKLIHSNLSSHKCDTCEKSFPSLSKLKRHTDSVHEGRKDYKCNICDKLFTEGGSLKKHIHSFHPSFYSKADDDVKIIDENRKKSQMCHSCGKSYYFKSNLKRHIYTIHEGHKDHSCDKCGKSFTERRSLKSHIRSFHDVTKVKKVPKIQICDNCGKLFPRSNSLKRHVQTVHNGLKENYVRKKQMCNFCGKSLSGKFRLKRHILAVHKGHRDYTCDSCGKSFPYQTGLKRHVLVLHEGIRDHKCDTCGKAFPTKTKLKIHIHTVHEGHKDHICVSCGKAYSTAQALRQHNKSVHEMQNLDPVKDSNIKTEVQKCDFCHEVFSNVNDIANHLVLYHINEDVNPEKNEEKVRLN